MYQLFATRYIKSNPGETIAIKITINVDEVSCANLNISKETLVDVLVLHVENGKDLFIDVIAQWDPTCFGIQLPTLLQLLKPVRCYSLDKIAALSTDVDEIMAELNILDVKSQSPNPPSTLSNQTLSLPKEVWRLTDFIYKYGTDIPSLFCLPGDASIEASIRSVLDTGIEFDIDLLFSTSFDLENASNSSLPQGDAVKSADVQEETVETVDIQEDTVNTADDRCETVDLETFMRLSHPSRFNPRGRDIAIHSMCSTLLLFIRTLPDPIVPYRLHRECIESSGNAISAKMILSKIGRGYGLFVYLCTFLREMGGGEEMVNVFARVMIPDEPGVTQVGSGYFGFFRDEGPGSVAWSNKRIKFLKLFI